MREAMANGAYTSSLQPMRHRSYPGECHRPRAGAVLGGWRTATAFRWVTQAGTTPNVRFHARVGTHNESVMEIALESVVKTVLSGTRDA